MNNIRKYITPLFYVLTLMKFYFEPIQLLINGLMIGVSVSAFIFLKGIKFRSLTIFPFIFLMFVGAAISFLFGSNYRLEDIVLVFVYWGIALIPLVSRLDYKLYSRMYLLTIVFFLLHIMLGSTPSTIFSISRNFISVLLLFCAIYHSISAYQHKLPINRWFLLLSLGICLWAGGRSGIFIFALLSLYSFFLAKTSWYLKISVVIFLIAGFYWFWVNYAAEVFENTVSRIEYMGIEDDARGSVNSAYIQVLKENILYVVTGAPLKKVPPIVELDLNPHNSFIRLHIYYSLLGFSCVVFMFITSFIYFFIKKNHLFFILLVALLLRSAVDSTAFHGPLDPPIFFIMFLILNKGYVYHESKFIKLV